MPGDCSTSEFAMRTKAPILPTNKFRNLAGGAQKAVAKEFWKTGVLGWVKTGVERFSSAAQVLPPRQVGVREVFDRRLAPRCAENLPGGSRQDAGAGSPIKKLTCESWRPYTLSQPIMGRMGVSPPTSLPPLTAPA